MRPLSSAATLRGRCRSLFTAAHFWANLVYLLYATLVVIIDFYLSAQAERAEPRPAAVADAADPYGYYDKRSVADFLYATQQVNAGFLAAAIVHLANAIMFALVWRTHTDAATGEPFAWTSYVMTPEVFNICEALLYLTTACLYPKEEVLNRSVDGVLVVPNTAYQDGVTADVKRLELTASLCGLAASVGWFCTWWATHERGPGRGLTLDDLELWALTLLFATYVIYVAYNALGIEKPSTYADTFMNKLYSSADCVYFCSAVMYVLCSLREEGFFNSLFIFGAAARALGWCAPAGDADVAEKAALPASGVSGHARAQAEGAADDDASVSAAGVVVAPALAAGAVSEGADDGAPVREAGRGR